MITGSHLIACFTKIWIPFIRIYSMFFTKSLRWFLVPSFEVFWTKFFLSKNRTFGGFRASSSRLNFFSYHLISILPFYCPLLGSNQLLMLLLSLAQLFVFYFELYSLLPYPHLVLDETRVKCLIQRFGYWRLKIHHHELHFL